MPWCGCVYYVLCSKTYNTFGGLFWSPAGSRWATRGAHIYETCLFLPTFSLPEASNNTESTSCIVYALVGQASETISFLAMLAKFRWPQNG